MLYVTLGILLCVCGFAQMVLSFFDKWKKYASFTAGMSSVMLGVWMVSVGLECMQ